MTAEPILDEIRAIKDRLADEARLAPDLFIENLKRWEAEHLAEPAAAGPVQSASS